MARANSRSPASVRTSARVDRVNSGTPSSRSSVSIWRATDDATMPRWRATAEKLPDCATSTKMARFSAKRADSIFAILAKALREHISFPRVWRRV
ncbi:hypothetical protein D9M69_650790 [compost metagenome]